MNDRYCVFNYGDCKRLDDAYAAGLAEGIRRARGAVDVERTAYDGYFQEVFNDILAAIDAVKGE